jgi:hypothetical protein
MLDTFQWVIVLSQGCAFRDVAVCNALGDRATIPILGAGILFVTKL